MRHSVVSSGISVCGVHGDVAAKPFGIVCIAQGTLPIQSLQLGFWSLSNDAIDLGDV